MKYYSSGNLSKISFIIALFFFSLSCLSQKPEKISVHFKFDKFDLDKVAKSKIDSLLQNKTILHISLQGHCDSIGSNTYNDVLSLNRVLEVKKYIASKNISASLIEIKALGKRVPLNNNLNETDRLLNRRVEIEIAVKTITPAQKTDTTRIIKKPQNENEKEVLINGTILNQKNQPLIAEITLNDKNGNEILSTTSDKDGKYSLKATLNKKENYTLIYYNDSSFIGSKRINLSNQRLPYKNLTTILPQLIGGNKYILENFLFVGDTSQLLPVSLPTLQALYKLMSKNKSLVIRIEGHVNYPHHWPNTNTNIPHSERYVPPGMNYKEFNQWLSEDRANMVYKYLINKGIDSKRLSTIGYGAGKMLFPDAIDEWEQTQNRRVEINVISFK